MGDIYLASIAYANDICLLASNQNDLQLMVKECIAGYKASGLETGMDKTFWTSTVPLTDSSLNTRSRGQKQLLMSVRGSAMTNRLQKATGVFEKWSSVLRDTILDLIKRILCFKASVLSSLG